MLYQTIKSCPKIFKGQKRLTTASFFVVVIVVFRYGCHCMQNGEWVCTAAKTDECLKSKGQKSLLLTYRNFHFILWIPANKSDSIRKDFAFSPTLTPNPFLHPFTPANSCHSTLILY